MEARLTSALAGRCGEQSARARTPSSSSGSAPDYLEPTSELVDNFTFACAHTDMGKPVRVAGFGHGPCCAYRDGIQHHRVEDPSVEEDLQPQAEVVESFESESAPPPPVVYDHYDEPNHDEIAEVLAILEYNEGASSVMVLVDSTTTSAVADVSAVQSALKALDQMSSPAKAADDLAKPPKAEDGVVRCQGDDLPSAVCAAAPSSRDSLPPPGIRAVPSSYVVASGHPQEVVGVDFRADAPQDLLPLRLQLGQHDGELVQPPRRVESAARVESGVPRASSTELDREFSAASAFVSEQHPDTPYQQMAHRFQVLATASPSKCSTMVLTRDAYYISKANTRKALEEVLPISRAQTLIALCGTIPGYWFTIALVAVNGHFDLIILDPLPFVPYTDAASSLASSILQLGVSAEEEEICCSLHAVPGDGVRVRLPPWPPPRQESLAMLERFRAASQSMRLMLPNKKRRPETGGQSPAIDTVVREVLLRPSDAKQVQDNGLTKQLSGSTNELKNAVKDNFHKSNHFRVSMSSNEQASLSQSARHLPNLMVPKSVHQKNAVPRSLPSCAAVQPVKANHQALAKLLKEDHADTAATLPARQAIALSNPLTPVQDQEEFVWSWTGVLANVLTGQTQDEGGAILTKQLAEFQPVQVTAVCGAAELPVSGLYFQSRGTFDMLAVVLCTLDEADTTVIVYSISDLGTSRISSGGECQPRHTSDPGRQATKDDRSATSRDLDGSEHRLEGDDNVPRHRLATFA